MIDSQRKTLHVDEEVWRKPGDSATIRSPQSRHARYTLRIALFGCRCVYLMLEER
jgi:hypothetical protein